MDCENLSISMVLEFFWYNPRKCHLHHLQNHLMLHNFQDIIFKIIILVVIHDGGHLHEMEILII